MLKCPKRKDQIVLIGEAIQTTTITPDQKTTMSSRYIGLLYEYKYRSTKYSNSFNSLRIIITVGSLIVPAILSVQYTAGNVTSTTANISADVYWCVWCLSLMVTISNGIMTLLKIDKKYYTLNTTYEHLLSEGWQYIHLSGKYSGFYTPSLTPSHENQFIYFCNIIEKIRMKHIEDEYYKLTENHPHATQDQLVPPTPKLPFTNEFDVSEKSMQLLNENTTIRRQNPKVRPEIEEKSRMDEP